jgi:MFS family permease
MTAGPLSTLNRQIGVHVSALTATKTADGLIDPKLVLAWLMSSLDAPGFLIGLLVPIREAGSLLPQLLIAQSVQRTARKKYWWVAGSALQGLAAFVIAASAVLLTGSAAGWAIVVSLALLAVARSACSVSYKDVLARTVEKGQRGRVSGLAGSLSALAVFAFAIALATGLLPREPRFIAGAIALAGGLWVFAAAVFCLLAETPNGEDEASGDALAAMLRPLREDGELRTYIATRGLLISTALAPPFLVMLGNAGEAAFGNLGLLILASSIAAIVSSYVWGALADRSSRQTLMLSGLLSGLTLAGAALSALAVTSQVPGLAVAGFVFLAQIAYQGARGGRKTHLTDMDTDDRKSIYTAVSNSVIGVLLLAGGAFGLLADWAGPETVLAVLAAMSLLSCATAFGLSEVQRDTD